jgi:hypothetical protein
VQHDGALDGQALRQRMRVGVAGKQHALEEHHRDRPHRRRAAKPRQHHLGEHRLYGEQQRRREEDRGGVDAQQAGIARHRGFRRPLCAAAGSYPESPAIGK